LNQGRIEQVGSPADVYERPSTSFVAGFVGVSNVLEGAAARSIAGDEGAFTIRPEKIRMLEPEERAGSNEIEAPGVITDVVYLGALTRFTVGLDAGGELVVLQQNLTTSSMQAVHMEGRRVALAWDRQFNRPVEGTGGMDGSEDPEREGA
ncbi:MAG: TOBE domain-containing protein, partial [Actinomycetota bacterium]